MQAAQKDSCSTRKVAHTRRTPQLRVESNSKQARQPTILPDPTLAGSNTLTSLKPVLVADLTMLIAPTQASAKDREATAWPRRCSWCWARRGLAETWSRKALAKSQLEKSVLWLVTCKSQRSCPGPIGLETPRALREMQDGLRMHGEPRRQAVPKTQLVWKKCPKLSGQTCCSNPSKCDVVSDWAIASKACLMPFAAHVLSPTVGSQLSPLDSQQNRAARGAF